jgi:hypothetical protein
VTTLLPRCRRTRQAAEAPDCRRNRVPVGTFFFTINLLDRSRGLLAAHIDVLRAAVREADERQR